MIEIINLEQFNVRLKATIQATGRLGFTSATVDAMELSEKTYVRFGKDSENDSLYFILVREDKGNCFKVMKSGDYYYLPTKLMFDSMGIDYKNATVMFDLVRMFDLDSQLDGEVYKMNKRIKNKKEMAK